MNLEEIVEEEFIITDGRIPKTELGKQIRPGIEATKLQKSRIVYQNGKLDMESRQHNYRRRNTENGMDMESGQHNYRRQNTNNGILPLGTQIRHEWS